MKYTHTKFFIGFLVIAFLIASPLAGFAKEKDNDNRGNKDAKERMEKSKDKKDRDGRDDEKKEIKKESKYTESNKKCIRAWGHIFAPGWIKNNGTIETYSHCKFPFGIGKKFHGYNASTTTDTIAPLISNIAFQPTKNQTEIRWTTNEKTTGTVFWGLTSSVDISSSSTQSINQNDFTKEHKVVLKNLNASTTYYIVIRSRDTSGNTTMSEVKSFMTLAPSPDTTVPTIGNVITLTSTSTAKIGWTTNEPATSHIFYGTSTPLNISSNSTLFIKNDNLVNNHTMLISGLATSTKYYMIIQSADAASNKTTSSEFSITTDSGL